MLGLSYFDFETNTGPNWDGTELADYLLYDYWQPHNAWLLISGFDWHEDLNADPCGTMFYDKGEDGYDDEVATHKNILKKFKENKELHRRLSNFWLMSGGEMSSESPKYFIEFAISKRIIPAWLDWAVKNKLYESGHDPKGVALPHKNGIAIPQNFDTQAPNYPQELDAAFQAWKAVSTIDDKRKPKARIRVWLDAHNNFSKLSKEAKERIATVANWDKLGGATRTD